MDSMRSLNTSLPAAASSSRQPAQDPPEELLQAFKVAALSVTKLYKTAANDQARARAEGYQDALDDLLAFLDKEDLGLSDGEGWKVRRWATERLDGRELSLNTDSEDDTEKRERSASPVMRRQSPPQSTTHATPARAPEVQAQVPAQAQTVEVPPSTSAYAADPTPSVPHTSIQPPSGNFTFRSPLFLSDLSLGDLNLSENNRSQDNTTHSQPNPSITVTRPSRSNLRHNNHNVRHGPRSSNAFSRSTAGQKRKINIGDFFDIGNIGPGKDGFGGGGKRGKFA